MNLYSIEGIQPVTRYIDKVTGTNSNDNDVTFDTVFQSALDLIKETDVLSNKAEEEEIKFAMGQSDSVVDLMAAQQKANLSLQYTVAVRNTVLDAYKELMSLQF
ncbi:MAG: flagellar hook-basal body complex protein FliE [Lachnospiraceae bacterium]|nr:flagellar hook-basal body complex protein FliE [Lachnospiraceae bacterium]